MISFNEALDKYYKLKSTYETEYEKNKKSLINNNQLSRREKRRDFQQLKPKCVNCKRPVKTIFSLTYDNENESRVLSAICGDKVNPCNLNININTGKYELLQNIIKNEESYIKDKKNMIIKNKNKLLFGYIDTNTVLEEFKAEKENINEAIAILEHYLLMYLDITDNQEKKEQTNINITDSYTIIKSIKSIMKQFDLTGDIQFVNDSVNIYLNQLIPKINTISKELYNNRHIDYNSFTNTYHLINDKYSIQQLEYDIIEPKVNSYLFGMNTTNKTKISKTAKQTKTPKNKTKKKTLIIQDSSSSSQNKESDSYEYNEDEDEDEDADE